MSNTFKASDLTVTNALAGKVQQTGARAYVKGLVEKASKAEQMTMWSATLVTLSARKQDLIGTGSAQTKQGDFVAAMGLSKSYGTLLMNLSRAIEHGITRDSKVWTFLNTAKGKSGAVSTVLKVEPSEVASTKVRATLDSWADNPAAVPTKSTEGRPNDGTDQGDKVETDPSTAPESPASRPATVDDIIATVIALLPEMSRANLDRLIEAVMAEDDRRPVGAQVAADVA